jgi:hypothetical protein
LIVVNSSTRQFNIPGADLVFGVESDSGSERKHFQCPRIVGNNLDLAGCFVRMNYRNANGEIDSYLIEDMTVDGDNVVFSWVLSPKVVMYKGNVTFVMCVVGPDTKVKWHTTLGRGQVLEGLEPDVAVIEEGTADVVAALIAMVEAQTAAVEAEGSKQIKAVQTAAKTAESDAVAQIEAKGANVRESIPDDYTALSEAVDGLVRGRAGAIVCSAEGSAVAVNDASDNYIQGLRIFGRSTQDGTPTPDAPVEIVSVKNPTITVNEQTLTIPRILPGIPVTSGRNYTDSDDQQWISDEVDLERGVYVQRCMVVELDGENHSFYTGQHTNGQYYIGFSNFEVARNSTVISSHYKSAIWSNNNGEVYCSNDVVILTDNRFTRVSKAKEHLAESPVTLLCMLETPIETPLSETEIAAYRALHSNYPNTTVLNNAGAHMVVKYAADTKLYIDNKITAMIGG